MRNRNIIYCLLALLLVSCNKDNKDPFYERTFRGKEGNHYELSLTFHQDGTCTVGRLFNPFTGESFNEFLVTDEWEYTKDAFGNIDMHSRQADYMGGSVMNYFMYFKSAQLVGDRINLVVSRRAYTTDAFIPLPDMEIPLYRQ